MIVPDYIEIKDSAGVLQAYLSPKSDGLKDCYPDAELNGASSLEFQLPLTSPKWQYITDDCRIIAGGREYTILKPDAIDVIRDGKKVWGKVMAQETWKLLDKKYVSVANDGTTPSWAQVKILSGGTPAGGYNAGSAGSALTYLLDGSGWSLGTCDVTGPHDLETEKESVLANIQKVQELWGGYLIWDSINKVLSLRDETLWQNYTGYQIRYGKNLKGITRTTSNDIINRLFPFGKDNLDISSVNGGVIYLDNTATISDVIYARVLENQDITDPQELKDWGTAQLAKLAVSRNNYQVKMVDLQTLPQWSHESFALGDMADVIDTDCDNINDRCRIIHYKYNLFQPWKVEAMELGDPIRKLANTISNASKAADRIDTIFNSKDEMSGAKLFDESIIADKIASAALDASKLNLNTVIVVDDTWTDNSPIAGKVAWNGHKLYYAGVEYAITGSNTALKYIYWVNGASSYSSSNTVPVLATGDFIIAVNNVGVHDTVWNNPAARQFIGSAMIANLAVLDANIANLNVSKLLAGTIAVNLAMTATLSIQDGTTIKAGMTAVGTGDSNVRIWAGDTFANRASAPFRVTQAGALVATNATVTGVIRANEFLNIDGVSILTTNKKLIKGDKIEANTVVAGSVAAENITGTYITGKTIRTAASGNDRIELKAAGFKCYDSSNNLHGWVLDQADFTELTLYRNDFEKGSIGYSDSTNRFFIGPKDCPFGIGDASQVTYLDGSVIRVQGNMTGYDGGTIDADTLEGNSKSDLDARYCKNASHCELVIRLLDTGYLRVYDAITGISKEYKPV